MRPLSLKLLRERIEVFDVTAPSGAERLALAPRRPGARAARLKDTCAFHNAHVAHGGQDITDPDTTRAQPLRWVETMALLGA